MTTPKLKICYIDMNNGVANQAVRCFRRLVDSMMAKAEAKNPGLTLDYIQVQPRNLNETPDRTADLFISSGGPGSPHDGYEDPWCTRYRSFLDWIVERNRADGPKAPQVLAICHSFELATLHFQLAEVAKRPTGNKFGVMPSYTTEDGARSELFAPFGERMFVWENRSWEAIRPNERRLAELGSRILARESRIGRIDKGEAILAFDFAPGIVGTQFHPEADRQGLLAWVYSAEHAAEFKQVYGEALYHRMIKTLDDPSRVARTYALFVPTWLHGKFDAWAARRGLNPVGPPVQDLKDFYSVK